MINIHEEIKKFKKIHYESELSRKQIGNLIFYLEVVMMRNSQIGNELQEALENLEITKSRIDFYRNITLPKSTD